MNRLPASQRYKRHKQRWKRYYQYTAIDECTRLRVLRIYPRSDQKTAIQFLDYLLSCLPFAVETIQTDNGAEFSPRSTGTCSTKASATPTSARPPRG